MALGFAPSFTKEVIAMTDYELLVIVLMMITLCFTIHQMNHKGKKLSRHPAQQGSGSHSIEGKKPSHKRHPFLRTL